MKNRPTKITLLGVPMDLGSDQRGVDMGPGAIRSANLMRRLTELGYNVHDVGDLPVLHPPTVRPTPARLKYLKEIVRVNRSLCRYVSSSVEQGAFPLVLGGDHSIAIGSLAGLSSRYRRLGVIWCDAHGDVNTAETSPSGNIHGMPLAAALGRGHSALTSVGGPLPKIAPEHIVLIGTRSLDPGERSFLKNSGITVFTMHDIDRWGMPAIMEKALDIAAHDTDGVHLSFDLDVQDPLEAPGVGTPVPGGLRLRESLLAMEMLSDAGVVVGAEFVEVNPALDMGNRTAETAVELICSLMGERIL